MEELEDGIREWRIRQDGAPEHFCLRQDCCVAMLSNLNANMVTLKLMVFIIYIYMLDIECQICIHYCFYFLEKSLFYFLTNPLCPLNPPNKI
jgi:hypothetical protein